MIADSGVSEGLVTFAVEAISAAGLFAHVLRIADRNLAIEFCALRKAGVQAVVALEHPANALHAEALAQCAIEHRMPAVVARDQGDAGALFGYGTSLRLAAKAMAPIAKQILLGTSIGQLPTQTVQQHELIINLHTARKIRCAIPADVMQRASQVIGYGIKSF